MQFVHISKDISKGMRWRIPEVHVRCTSSVTCMEAEVATLKEERERLRAREVY
jgi:hypothetical protein